MYSQWTLSYLLLRLVNYEYYIFIYNCKACHCIISIQYKLYEILKLYLLNKTVLNSYKEIKFNMTEIKNNWKLFWNMVQFFKFIYIYIYMHTTYHYILYTLYLLWIYFKYIINFPCICSYEYSKKILFIYLFVQWIYRPLLLISYIFFFLLWIYLCTHK